MEQLKEYADHYHNGLINAGEFIRKVSLYLYHTRDTSSPMEQHNLADKLSEQLIK